MRWLSADRGGWGRGLQLTPFRTTPPRSPCNIRLQPPPPPPPTTTTLSPPPPPHYPFRVVKESLTPLNFTIVLPTVVDLLERAVPSDPNAGGGGGGGGRRGEQRVGHPQLLPELMGLLLSGEGGAGGRAARGAHGDPIGG